MSTVKEIYNFLDSIWKFNNMPEYDNSGFLIGDKNTEVTKIMCCLDATADVIGQAKAFGAQLIVSHHPIIFDPLKRLDSNNPAYAAASAGIAVISVHIPIDEHIEGANKVLCERLGLILKEPFGEKKSPCGDRLCEGWVGELLMPQSPREFAVKVGQILSSPVMFCDGGKPIKNAVVCGGSGSFLIELVIEAGYDCFITSQLKHQDVLIARAADITLIDATHFGTEIHIAEILREKLAQEFTGIEVALAKESNPLQSV
ncbi:MAG TPA: Nif3-like dinuclear metal center hexameric protein [Oscillospiraceae bacterium]|nr:Nif3-like dinuclear metal center hexameric protein [Oscillospiraceae bacterium]HPF56121.1 Nif3-like dinuclear metal center hexameric protein [Clostridiales bacterium]HPK34345.1 Nif3-like dinuclear metal center hexameric protein [Oscillospiraceae bacterium]HPR75124.1 Nif3-like dinuclear metal center hexameric protein [Oscillospiraceae bacterium]